MSTNLRNYCAPLLRLWRVTLDEREIDHRSPVVHVVALNPADAANEALGVMAAEWGPQAANLRVLSVVAVNPVNAIAMRVEP